MTARAWSWLADVIYRSEAAVVTKALGMIAAGCLWLLYLAHRISTRPKIGA